MSVIKTLKSLKTFYPPDPKDPNYQQKVTDSLQQLSSEVNRLSDKVRELDIALTEHEAFYDAPIVCDQLWLKEKSNYEGNNHIVLSFQRQEQNWIALYQNLSWNGQFGEKYNGMHAGRNRKARTRYPHTLSMLSSESDMDAPGSEPATDIAYFRFPVTGLYRITLTAAFEFHAKSGGQNAQFGTHANVRTLLKGGHIGFSSLYTKNIQTATVNIPYTASMSAQYQTVTSDVIVNVTRAVGSELGRNFDLSGGQHLPDTVFFKTGGFFDLSYDITIRDGRNSVMFGSQSYDSPDSQGGGTNVIFQRIGPAIFDTPT